MNESALLPFETVCAIVKAVVSSVVPLKSVQRCGLRSGGAIAGTVRAQVVAFGGSTGVQRERSH